MPAGVAVPLVLLRPGVQMVSRLPLQSCLFVKAGLQVGKCYCLAEFSQWRGQFGLDTSVVKMKLPRLSRCGSASFFRSTIISAAFRSENTDGALEIFAGSFHDVQSSLLLF